MAGIAFEKHTLPNGLDVILHQDRSIPVAAVNVWYHVGSKDEEVGRTGFAHLFEHIMFRGTRHHKASHFEPLAEDRSDAERLNHGRPDELLGGCALQLPGAGAVA